MDINSDILGGKLLLSNNDNNLSNDYKLISSDYTDHDMYYTYIEAIIPIDKLESYSEDGSTTPLTIAFGKDSDVEVNIYKDNLDAYATTSEGTKIHYTIIKTGDIEYYLSQYGPYDNQTSNKYKLDYKTIYDKDYMIFSIMILPMLNYDEKLEYLGNIQNKESNSILFFIDQMQVGFKTDAGGALGDGRLPFLRIKQFYNNKDNFSKLIKITKIPSKCYVIWNTEYERFIYKNLAIMCYNENKLKNIEVGDIKKDFLSLDNNFEILLIRNNGYCRQEKDIINSFYNTLHFSNDFLNNNSNPIKFYMELITNESFYSEPDSDGGGDIYIGFGSINEKYKNIFDSIYGLKYSQYDINKFGFDSQDVVNDNDKELYYNYTATYEGDLNWTITFNNVFNNINKPIDCDTTNIFDNYDNNSKNIVIYSYMIALNKDTNKLHEYIIGNRYENYLNTYENYSIFKDLGEINLTEGNFIPFIIYRTNMAVQPYITCNFGESKFHVIPDIFPEGSDGYKQLYRSVENGNWKNLWKYNRTIQFTTFLQDNPVIFPLDLIRDNNDNFFLEIITTRNNNSLLEFALGSGIEFYNKNDNAVFKTLTSGIYHCEYIDNSEYQTNSSGTEQINGIKFIKTDSTTGTFGEKEYSYYDKIAFYYNKNTDNENIYVLNIQNGNTVNQLGKVPVSNLLPLKNIMVHLRPRDINNATAGTDLGTITINFGYNSDYFQEYIDNLLSYDAYIEFVDLSYYARDNIPNYDTITEIPQEHLDYLNSGLVASNMSYMFYGCRELITIPKLNIDTSNVTDMSYMFYACKSLTSLDLSNFDTSNVTNMSNMFYYSLFTSLDISNWDTSKVTDMSNMFFENMMINSLDISNWDTSKVTDMSNMFYNCINLNTIEGIIDMRSCTDYSLMFGRCAELTGVKIKNPPKTFDGASLSSSQYEIVS